MFIVRFHFAPVRCVLGHSHKSSREMPIPSVCPKRKELRTTPKPSFFYNDDFDPFLARRVNAITKHTLSLAESTLPEILMCTL